MSSYRFTRQVNISKNLKKKQLINQNTLEMFKTCLHSNDGVNKKQHGNEKTNVRKSFEALDKSPEQNPNRVALTQKFD